MIMLNGLTDKLAAELLLLAKSWLSPPKMETTGSGLHSEGYDPTQKAFVLAGRDASAPSALGMTLRATKESPVMNPVILVRNWGSSEAKIEIDGKPAPPGKDVRAGRIHGLESEDLVLWLRMESTTPVRISVSPVKARSIFPRRIGRLDPQGKET